MIASATPASPSPRPIPPSQRPRIIDMTTQPGLEAFYRVYRAEWGVNITSYAIDRNHDGYLDSRKYFTEEFSKRIQPDFNGIVSLDWEATIFDWLRQDPESPEFQCAVRNLTELLVLAKRLRPQARIGYYGIPPREYWKRDDDWRKRSRALAGLLRHADWVGPSIYHLYKSGSQQAPEQSLAYAVENVQLALEIAQAAGNKPVYVWVHHRYHGSNKEFGGQPVDDDDFTANIKAIAQTEFNGKRIDGFIWWGADYSRLKRQSSNVDVNTVRKLQKLHEHYFRLIAQTINDVYSSSRVTPE